MQAVGHQRTRRRKKSLRVAPLARSQSLDVVATASPSSVARRKAMSRDGYNYGDTLENSRGPHLPPLGGRKGRRIRLESPLQQFLPGMEASLRETSTAARSRGTPPTAGKTSSSSSSFSSSSSSSSPASSSVQADPYRPGAESSPASSAVQPDPCRPVTEWVDAADIFVQPGQSAGIAFQWMETPTAAGLSVLAVTEGSLAAKHGGVAPGMLLVEVSRKRVDGMGQDEVMRVVQAAASLPRVLTLARILAAPSQAAVGARRNLRRETQPEDAPAHKALDSFVAFDRFPAATSSPITKFINASSHRPPSSDDGLRALRSNSSPPLSDGGAYRASDSVGATPARATHSTANMVSSGPRRLTSPEHTLALRFVGSRGNIALFDRDHVLGLKNRDIEFVPTGSRTKAQRVNSKKSLGELTRDWRNDPCSTPARRRRLINDACKAIVRSYTWASVERVAELRREEVFASRIQGAARMWAAQKVRTLKLAECRQKAALTLQCGWLSCAARRRVATLMEDRDHARRVDRRKRLNREAQERRHREEVRMGAEQREIEREERRRRLEVVVVSVQRKVREAQEHRRLTQAERLRERQCESKMIRATTSAQAAFRWRRQVRERRSRMGLLEKMKQKGKRDAAASRVQRAWRRHRAAIFDHQRRETKETPPSLPSLSAVNPGGSGTEKPSVPATKVNVAQEYTPSPPRNHPKILGGWSEGQQPDRDNSSRQGWSALDLPRAAANACEGVGAAADSAAITDCGRRSNTSDKVAEESAPSRQNTTRHLPPSGMMTVRVRRGSEETSLVTPIVLTESGIAASEAAADDDGDVHLGLDNAQKNGAHQPWTVHVGSPNAASKCSTYSTERFHASGDAEVANARSPSSMLTKEAHGGNSPAELATPTSSTAEVGKHQAGDAKSKALVFLSTATRKSKENTARPWSALAATTNATPIAGGEGETVAAAASGTALDNTKPAAEQFFMEDSQVYLGCATCGVKYLVEAVDPRLPESTQDQPVPEVLYLCTTCGETLKSDEDGRWRRRRRPSSAPAAPGRRDTLFDRPPNWLAESREGWSRATATAGGGTEAGAGLVEASKDAATPRRVSGWDEGTTAKLKYAPCARIIQHAYRDFRHRQYLRDWASALLGRWLLDRTRARHQWRRRLAFRRAVVRVQSAARAASARVRFSALRAARLRLWMDKVAGLLNSNLNDDNDDLSPSPVAARILHELDLASLPPPPPPPPTPVPPPTSQPIPPTSSPPPAPAPSSPFNEAASSSSRSSTNSPSRSGGYRVGARETKDEGCALAHALAPRMGAPPPGCPTAYQVDWGQSAVKLTLAFPPRVRNHAVVECVADSSSGYR